MKSLNRIENLICTSIENKIVKLLSRFQSDPCNHVEVISLPRLKKVVPRKTSLKFKVIDRAQQAFRGAAGKSLTESFRNFFSLQYQGPIVFMVLKYCLSQKKN